METNYLQIMHAIQSASWGGYVVSQDNGRITAFNEKFVYYLTTDNNGRSYHWVDITDPDMGTPAMVTV